MGSNDRLRPRLMLLSLCNVKFRLGWCFSSSTLLLAVAAVGFLAAAEQTAFAACGDYVIVAGESHLPAAHTSAVSARLELDSALHFAQPTHRRDAPVRPCSGVHCRQGIPPLPAPVPVVELAFEHWAHFYFSDSLAPEASTGYCAPMSNRPIPGYPMLLEEPPRA